MYFIENGSANKFDARGAKLFSEAWGGYSHDGVGFVSVYGALGNGFWEWTMSNYTMLGAILEDMERDDKVDNIVFLINSPGGMAEGLFDLCDRIKQCSKPTYAYITGMACSAAYAIASACKSIYAEKDAETGCCGCYAEAMEFSDEAYKDAGILRRIFRSKVSPKKNLSVITNKEAQDEYQKAIDAHGESYLRMCAENRGVEYETALETFGKGAVVSVEYGLENGMVDRICPLEDAIEDICNGEEKDTTPTLVPEGEGEEEMDIAKMSAEQIMASMSDEQKRAMFDALCTENPSLVKEREDSAKEAEKARLDGLNALRNGTTEVDAIVDSAITDGRQAIDIAMEVIVAMKNHKPTEEDTKAKALEELLDASTTVAAPREDSAEGDNPYLVAAEVLNKSKEE